MGLIRIHFFEASYSQHSRTKAKQYSPGDISFKTLTFGPFLTLRVRNGPNLQSYLFQVYISLNPGQVEQN